MAGNQFEGFPGECLDFFAELDKNNDKCWFEAHRSIFEEKVMAPARAFVVAMGERLEMLAPGIHAEPKVNQSIFRINRDTRFSHDKRPYKTHLGIFFWEGRRPRMDCSGFYFHLEPGLLFLAAGICLFPKAHLIEFRRSAVHPEHGPSLREAVDQVRAKGLEIEGRHYSRLPRGFDPAHPNAELLLYHGLSAYFQTSPAGLVSSARLVDFCLGHFVDMNPLHRWLVGLTNRLGD